MPTVVKKLFFQSLFFSLLKNTHQLKLLGGSKTDEGLSWPEISFSQKLKFSQQQQQQQHQQQQQQQQRQQPPPSKKEILNPS